MTAPGSGNTPPESAATEAPRPGLLYEAGDIRLQLVREAPFEIFFKADIEIVTLSLCHTKVECAFNSDRISPQENRPGMVNFHPAGTEIFVRSLRRDGDMIVLELPPALRSGLTEELKLAPLDASHISVPTRGAVSLAQSARRFLLQGGPGGRLAAESLATLSVLEMLRSHAPSAKPPSPGLSPAKLKATLAYIEAHLDRDLGLADLAAACGMTLYHFARSFKQTSGFSPHQYVLERRLLRARELLRATTAPIAEIAYTAGFSSQSHMTDAFRRLLGTTPGRYRRDVDL